LRMPAAGGFLEHALAHPKKKARGERAFLVEDVAVSEA